MYGLPIKKIEFHTEHNHDLVLSMDAQVSSGRTMAWHWSGFDSQAKWGNDSIPPPIQQSRPDRVTP